MTANTPNLDGSENVSSPARSGRVDEPYLLAAIVESSDDAIASKDLNGIVMTWNSGAERIFGYRAEEIIGKHISLLIPSERQSEEGLIQSKIHNGESIKHYETVRIHKDGHRFDVSVTVSPIRNGNGQIIGASKIARDITGQKMADEKARLMNAAVEAAANGIVITDRRGVIVWINRAFEQLTGFVASEVIGMTPRLLKSGREEESFYRNMWATIAAGKIWAGELINKRKDGSFYHEDMMIAPIVDTTGKISHFVAIKQDASERVKATQEREHLIEQLKLALSDVKALTGLLPICAGCKKIRDDSGYWSQVEVYIRDHSNATFTHGICPECAQKMLDELNQKTRR